MYIVIIITLIIVWILYWVYLDTQEEQERLRKQAYQEYRDMIYHWDYDCKWCGKEYKIKDGSEHFCSAKCEYQHDKARNK